jgi:hypothetical protein
LNEEGKEEDEQQQQQQQQHRTTLDVVPHQQQTTTTTTTTTKKKKKKKHGQFCVPLSCAATRNGRVAYKGRAVEKADAQERPRRQREGCQEDDGLGFHHCQNEERVQAAAQRPRNDLDEAGSSIAPKPRACTVRAGRRARGHCTLCPEWCKACFR